jgi:hypothetical protein
MGKPVHTPTHRQEMDRKKKKLRRKMATMTMMMAVR